MEEQLSAQLKQQLRDVQLPSDISWWPLAYGWWILLVLALAGIIALSCYFLKKRRRNAYRHSAIKELHAAYAQWQQQSNTATYLQSANAILKRSVLHISTGNTAAGQSGVSWLNTLASSTSNELSAELRNALASQVYQANAEADIDLLHQEICEWLRNHQAKLTPSSDDGSENSKSQGIQPTDTEVGNA